MSIKSSGITGQNRRYINTTSTPQNGEKFTHNICAHKAKGTLNRHISEMGHNLFDEDINKPGFCLEPNLGQFKLSYVMSKYRHCA